MEKSDFDADVRLYSQSSLHRYITGTEQQVPRQASSLNPYRKKMNLLSFFGLDRLVDILDELDRSTSKGSALAKANDSLGADQEIEKREGLRSE